MFIDSWIEYRDEMNTASLAIRNCRETAGAEVFPRDNQDPPWAEY